jgi:hypothetical protein
MHTGLERSACDRFGVMRRRRGDQDKVHALKRALEGRGVSCIHLSRGRTSIMERIHKSLRLIQVPSRDDEFMICLCK